MLKKGALNAKTIPFNAEKPIPTVCKLTNYKPLLW